PREGLRGYTVAVVTLIAQVDDRIADANLGVHDLATRTEERRLEHLSSEGTPVELDRGGRVAEHQPGCDGVKVRRDRVDHATLRSGSAAQHVERRSGPEPGDVLGRHGVRG